VPSFTVIVPFGGIRRVDSGVLTLSGTVPVPVAGAGEVLELDELALDAVEAEEVPELPADELPDDDVELPDALCSAA